MPSFPRSRILSKKHAPAPGLCILMDNGVPCDRSIASRGLCSLHRTHLANNGQLEDYVLPIKSKKIDLKPNPSPQAGRCAVLQAGIPCLALAKRRGLCLRHYAGVWQRPDLRLDDFARDEIKPILDRKRKIVEGICLVRERMADGSIVPCEEKSHARGVCHPHYKKLEKDPELFKAVADPPRKNDTFRVKKEPRPGICIAIQNDEGCTVPTSGWRRLCKNHYMNFKRVGILNELTDHFRGSPPTLERKKPEDQLPGACLLVVNGVACRNVPKRRGLCSRCLNIIEKQGLSPDGFARPASSFGEKRESIEKKLEIIRGVAY